MERVTKTMFALLIILSVAQIEGARILAYFPTPSISHQVVFRPITEALAKRGHEVIVVTTDPLPKGKAPVNLTEIDVHDVSYEHWEELFLRHKGEKHEILNQITALFKKLATVITVQMETPAVQTMLKDKNKEYFDLLLLEAFNRPLLGLAHKFDAPIIHISSFGAASSQCRVFGAPAHPLLYPSPGRQRLYNLTLWEKGVELVKNFAIEYIVRSTSHFDFEVAKKNFGHDLPSFNELGKKVQMIFLNEHPIWADNRPVPPSMLYIGGIHQSEDNDLPKDLKNYLDSSSNGVIYISFGTNVLPSLLPTEKIKIMTKVISHLPYNVLWKWDKNSNLPGQSSNIRVSHWFPQSDLLKHPNVKLFITQGGLQSTDETINAAVPVIGIPMLGDQWYNAEKYVRHGIGLQLDITTLTEEEFRNAVTAVIEDKSFKNNILRLKSLMRDFPIKPVDKAVWWIDHVLKYGGSHLQSPAANLSWTEYYEINLVLIVLVILILILVILGCVFKLALKYAYNIYITHKKLKDL